MDTLHTIRHNIHHSQSIQELSSGNFLQQLFGLLETYPVENSQNYHMYIHAAQEYNRKLDSLGEEVTEAVDAGFRPIDLDAFLGNNNPSPGIADHIKSEDNTFILQQNSFKIILEQDD